MSETLPGTSLDGCPLPHLLGAVSILVDAAEGSSEVGAAQLAAKHGRAPVLLRQPQHLSKAWQEGQARRFRGLQDSAQVMRSKRESSRPRQHHRSRAAPLTSRNRGTPSSGASARSATSLTTLPKPRR